MKYLLFFISVFYSAQVTRYVYDFEFKRDSTLKHFQKDRTILEISDREVSYFDFGSYTMDSINLKNGGRSSLIPALSINVYRKSGSKANKNFVYASSIYYQFESKDDIAWELHEDLKTFNHWQIQKATCNYGGRKWTAWFTKDIPIPEGPYKFTGLPGLIVEIYDDRNNFRFSLKEIYSKKQESLWEPHTIFGMKRLKVTREKYNELLLNEYNNPFQEFRSMTGDWTLVVHGKTIKNVAGLNEVRRDQQKNIKKHHNPIEINMAVKYEKYAKQNIANLTFTLK